jgi:predicted ester cyclase
MTDVRDVVERLVRDVWNGHAVQAVEELVDPGHAGPEAAAVADGAQQVLAWHLERRRSFPDLTYEIVDLLVDGDRAALRWRARGTQGGPYGPVPPTGRSAEWEGATFLRIRAGKVVETWSVNEMFQLVQQLGARVVPPVIDEEGS